LDKNNSKIVIELFLNALRRGATVIGIFHDQETADILATQRIDMNQFRKHHD
jgi:alpha-D-ribose 1-methylphosphonate 5-triphosphate synthase subunit PhnL